MIRIIKGSYGLRVGKTVRPVKEGDAPIELEKEQEARLVRLGVAEYVETAVDEVPAGKGIKGKKPSSQKGRAVKEEAETAVPEGDASDGGEEPPELSAEDPVDDE